MTDPHTGQHAGQPTEPLAEQPVEQPAEAGVQDVPTEAGSGDAPGPGPGGLADESPNDLVADLAAAQTRVAALTDDLNGSRPSTSTTSGAWTVTASW